VLCNKATFRFIYLSLTRQKHKQCSRQNEANGLLQLLSSSACWYLGKDVYGGTGSSSIVFILFFL